MIANKKIKETEATTATTTETVELQDKSSMHTLIDYDNIYMYGLRQEWDDDEFRVESAASQNGRRRCQPPSLLVRLL